jgi:glyceraldehyde 3-phosphate dehydrogenase
MTVKVGINGFGRIGRSILRALIENNITDVEIVAINDLAPSDALVNLLKYDSVHGRLPVKAELKGETLHINGSEIRMTALRNPEDLPWKDVDIAFECTGHFKDRDGASKYLKAGAKRVLISAPGKDVDRTVVFGVNHADLTGEDVIVSNASCTTNCLAPVALVLDQTFGIKTGYMTTVHAFTGSQPTHDSPLKDPYRARAASVSMIPTTTGAAKAISLVLPQLKGKLEGSAIRVPTPNVSLVDLCVMLNSPATVDSINAAMKAASDGPMKGVLGYEQDPLVSIDFNHDPHSSTYTPAQTSVTEDGMVRIISWYDNEWGFSNRMIDVGRYMGDLL